MKLFYIGAFGVLGVYSRYFLGVLVARYLPPPFPYGTFLINVIGSFLIGLVFVLGTERAVISTEVRLGLMVGFLGGFTTFSSYSLELVRLVEESEYGYAAAYFGLSSFLGFSAALAGVFAGRALGGGLR